MPAELELLPPGRTRVQPMVWKLWLTDEMNRDPKVVAAGNEFFAAHGVADPKMVPVPSPLWVEAAESGLVLYLYQYVFDNGYLRLCPHYPEFPQKQLARAPLAVPVSTLPKGWVNKAVADRYRRELFGDRDA